MAKEIPKYHIGSGFNCFRDKADCIITKDGKEIMRSEVDGIASMMAFLSKSGDTATQFQKALKFLNS